MHGLVETWWRSDVDVPAGSVFQGVFSLNTQGLPQDRTVCVSRLVSLSVSAGNHQTGCSTDQKGKLSFSLFVPWYTDLIHCFPSLTKVYHYHHVIV